MNEDVESGKIKIEGPIVQASSTGAPDRINEEPCFHSIFGTAYLDSTVELPVIDWAEYIRNKITLEDDNFKIKFDPLRKSLNKSSARERLKCPNCYFLTDNQGNLKQHLKIHLRSDKSTQHQCKFCNFNTKYKNSLKGHMKRHERLKGKKDT